ncbi:MAG: M23 family metallopeptidase [Vampirovibrionales bacterium]|nr:M23 family metallopeptidase [Vampirovibrionales bacterium]
MQRYLPVTVLLSAFLFGLFGVVSANDAPPVPSAGSSQEAVVSLVNDLAKPCLKAPTKIRQGEAFEVLVSAPSEAKHSPTPQALTLDGKTFPLYAHASDSYSALLSIPVDAKPGGHTLRVVFKGPATTAVKTPELSQVLQVLPGGYARQNIGVSSSIGGLQPEPGELAAVQALKVMRTAGKRWQLPLSAPTPDCLNSPFGNLRFHNGVFTGNYHKGIDLRSPAGRPVVAPADATVAMARKWQLHGGTVGLDHGQGLTSIYIHLSQILVSPGQQVKRGQIIGKVGSTGFATGPHLHWGVFAAGEPVNPFWMTSGVRACGR